MQILAEWMRRVFRGGVVRRWRYAADEAVQAPEQPNDRARIALELAARFAVKHTDMGVSGLEIVVAGLIEDSWMRALRAAQHLDVLRGWLARAEYEDVAFLAQEAAWTEHYLLPILLKPLKLRLQRPAACSTEGWEERLLRALAEQVSPRIEMVLAA